LFTSNINKEENGNRRYFVPMAGQGLVILNVGSFGIYLKKIIKCNNLEKLVHSA